MFQTNVTGLINMTQAILPIFKARPDGGAGDIINIGSIAGRDPYAGGSIYCATKAAVRAFTDSLRRELIDTRIRVMEIDPGQVETVSWSRRIRIMRWGGKRQGSADDELLGRRRIGVLGCPFLRRQGQGGCRICVSALVSILVAEERCLLTRMQWLRPSDP